MVLLFAKFGPSYLNDLDMHRILLLNRYFFRFGLNSDCCYGCHDSWPWMLGKRGMPRRTVTPVTPVMPVMLIAASQAAVSAAPWASAMAARLAAVLAAALPFYHFRARTAMEQEKKKEKKELTTMTTLSGNTWAFNVSTI